MAHHRLGVVEALNDAQAVSEDKRLAALGYRPELSRVLSLFDNFSVAFSYLSPMVGIYSLYTLGLGTGGPRYIWTIPVVVGLMMLVALVFGELASEYPLSGALYQYGKYTVGPRYGWFIGWIYGFALLATVASVDSGVVAYVTSLSNIWFHTHLDPASHPIIFIVTGGIIVLSAILNTIGAKIMGRVARFGVYVETIGTFGVFLALAAVGFHQHFGFNDRHYPLLLADGRVARERMRVRLHASRTRQGVAHLNHCPPFRKARSELAVLSKALAKPIVGHLDPCPRVRWPRASRARLVDGIGLRADRFSSGSVRPVDGAFAAPRPRLGRVGRRGALVAAGVVLIEIDVDGFRLPGRLEELHDDFLRRTCLLDRPLPDILPRYVYHFLVAGDFERQARQLGPADRVDQPRARSPGGFSDLQRGCGFDAGQGRHHLAQGAERWARPGRRGSRRPGRAGYSRISKAGEQDCQR